MSNPYTNEVNNNLPRLLSLFDTDKTSKSCGIGDRFRWAWGLIDFNNVAFQGAVNGLARLWTTGLWPFKTQKNVFINRIDSMFQAADCSIHSDGSIDQAFPNERSYALTGFVAFDFLVGIDLLRNQVNINKIDEWKNVVKKLINFLIRSNETHGLISNHLAGAAAALFRWHKITADSRAESKARKLLSCILKKQSVEGWFLEYKGADPGYQTLCTHYLADVHRNRPDLGLLEPLHRSLKFLWYFAHPDGSFGGTYGSRCTKFYFPSGIMALAPEIPQAAALANFMTNSIMQRSVVTLSAIDETNLVPMFNSYAWAAALMKISHLSSRTKKLPALDSVLFRKIFQEAGIVIDRGIRHYTIINCHKGGVVYHYLDKKQSELNAGVAIKSKSGKNGSTQSINSKTKILIKNNLLKIKSNFSEMPKKLPKPIDFVFIRLLGITLFKIKIFRELFKRYIVKRIITNNKKWPVTNIRIIFLGQKIKILDQLKITKKYKIFKNPGSFVAIHMASKGYWQLQDEYDPNLCKKSKKTKHYKIKILH